VWSGWLKRAKFNGRTWEFLTPARRKGRRASRRTHDGSSVPGKGAQRAPGDPARAAGGSGPRALRALHPRRVRYRAPRALSLAPSRDALRASGSSWPLPPPPLPPPPLH